MVRKFSIFIIFFLLSLNTPVLSDSWDDLGAVEKAWDGQKTITNKEYEDVIEALQEKDNAVKEKKRKKKFKKLMGGGDTLHEEIAPTKELKEIPDLKKNEDGVLVNVPVNIMLKDKILEKGYYKLYGERNDNKEIVIKFYQSQFLKGEIIAIETEYDFEEELLDFAKIHPHNDNFVKLIFGSLDFNAYVYIPFKE